MTQNTVESQLNTIRGVIVGGEIIVEEQRRRRISELVDVAASGC